MPTSSPEHFGAAGCGRRSVLRSAAMIGGGLFAGGLLGGRAIAAPAAAAMVVQLPAVTLLDGSRYQPETGRGNALIVVFWSVDCPFCRNDLPHVEKLQRAATGRPLKLLTASIDSDRDAVVRYTREKGYSFPVTLDSAALRAPLAARRVIPLTCCIDRSGVLRESIPGEMFEEDVLGLLKYAT